MILFSKSYVVSDGGTVVSKGGPGILVMGGLVSLYACLSQSKGILDKKEFKKLCVETWNQLEKLAKGDK